MTGNELRQQVCSIMNSWIGATKGSTKHLEILKIYNNHTPLAVGYTVQVNDAYCATTVSAAWIKAGIADYTGTECGVDRFIAIAKQKGIWVEADNYVPKIGDAICYVWSDGDNYASYDNTSSADHIGIVTKVNGNNFTVTEGNMSGGVTGTRDMTVNGRYIRGFICPDYDTIAKAISGGTTMSTMNGIDISAWQDGIDIAKLTTTEFVIAKATQGVSYTSECFTEQIEAALKAGKKIGAYHYATGIGAEKEAEYFVSVVKPYLGKILLALDWETGTDASSKNTAWGDVSYAKKFLDKVKELTGVSPLLYTSQSEVDGRDWSSVANAGYKLWLAQYASMDVINGYKDSPWYDCSASAWGHDWVLHQYGLGKITGSNMTLDLDKFYGSASDWDSLANGGHKYTIGWHKNDNGWWYSPDGDTYYADICKYITDAWYCFDKEGYMLHDTEFDYEGKTYVIDSDGRVTEKEKEPDAPVDGKDKRYYYLKDITEDYYRPTIDKLIKKEILKGKEGEGENLVVDLSEDAVRILVMLDRTGVFGE